MPGRIIPLVQVIMDPSGEDAHAQKEAGNAQKGEEQAEEKGHRGRF